MILQVTLNQINFNNLWFRISENSKRIWYKIQNDLWKFQRNYLKNFYITMNMRNSSFFDQPFVSCLNFKSWNWIYQAIFKTPCMEVQNSAIFCRLKCIKVKRCLCWSISRFYYLNNWRNYCCFNDSFRFLLSNPSDITNSECLENKSWESLSSYQQSNNYIVITQPFYYFVICSSILIIVFFIVFF